MKMAPTHYKSHEICTTKLQETKMAPPYFTMQHIGGSFQNDKKITGNMKKKIQEMKMAPTHFTMKPIGAFFKMKGKLMGV